MRLSEASYRITQKIWGSTDAILLIFAGSAAEFAVIKSVDWLFYTNRLPSAPIDRLFDTARFAQLLFFGSANKAAETIDIVNKIHGGVEKSRKQSIPNWAYKDVLFMLIDYSEKSHEVVFGEMTIEEKVAYFEAAMAVGIGMNLQDLPKTYDEYLYQRNVHLKTNYEYSDFTKKLFQSYKYHLGNFRFQLLKLVQASIIPEELKKVLGMKPKFAINLLLKVYHYLPGNGEKLKMLHGIILPAKYRKQLKQMGEPFSKELV